MKQAANLPGVAQAQPVVLYGRLRQQDYHCNRNPAEADDVEHGCCDEDNDSSRSLSKQQDLSKQQQQIGTKNQQQQRSPKSDDRETKTGSKSSPAMSRMLAVDADNYMLRKGSSTSGGGTSNNAVVSSSGTTSSTLSNIVGVSTSSVPSITLPILTTNNTSPISGSSLLGTITERANNHSNINNNINNNQSRMKSRSYGFALGKQQNLTANETYCTSDITPGQQQQSTITISSNTCENQSIANVGNSRQHQENKFQIRNAVTLGIASGTAMTHKRTGQTGMNLVAAVISSSANNTTTNQRYAIYDYDDYFQQNIHVATNRQSRLADSTNNDIDSNLLSYVDESTSIKDNDRDESDVGPIDDPVVSCARPFTFHRDMCWCDVSFDRNDFSSATIDRNDRFNNDEIEQESGSVGKVRTATEITRNVTGNCNRIQNGGASNVENIGTRNGLDLLNVGKTKTCERPGLVAGGGVGVVQHRRPVGNETSYHPSLCCCMCGSLCPAECHACFHVACTEYSGLHLCQWANKGYALPGQVYDKEKVSSISYHLLIDSHLFQMTLFRLKFAIRLQMRYD